jgi:LETM1 and EF-hand domain-containing protein 1
MAKFLQETIAETGVPGSDDARAAKEFSDFFRKVRAVGAGTFLPCVAFPDSIC